MSTDDDGAEGIEAVDGEQSHRWSLDDDYSCCLILLLNVSLDGVDAVVAADEHGTVDVMK